MASAAGTHLRVPPRPTAYAAGGKWQAYSVSRHLGVQFHLEVTPRILGGWVTAGRAPSLDTQGVLEVTSREYATASSPMEGALR